MVNWKNEPISLVEEGEACAHKLRARPLFHILKRVDNTTCCAVHLLHRWVGRVDRVAPQLDPE